MSTKLNETYLGDGVYAVYDGYGIMLDLRCQNDWQIYLEPGVVESFELFVATIRKGEKSEAEDHLAAEGHEGEHP
jgi:hypothetical protein